MQDIVLVIGLACLIGAIVGGGLKVVNVELPLVASLPRQILLGMVGGVLILGALVSRPLSLPTWLVPAGSGSGSPGSAPPPPLKSTQPTQPPPPVTAPGSKDSAPSKDSEPTVPKSGPTLSEASISLSKNSGPPGTAVNISGKGFTPGETIVIRFHTRELKRVSADGQGTFSGESVQVPSDWSFKGQFQFIASGVTSIKSATMPFQVT